MGQRTTTLGDCPACDAVIPRVALLISYERDGWPAMFAECPECGEVVHPA
jgi:predicted RNA-binding Zn-ribbon protein involved in translation (DUF1610 family)